MNKPSVLAIIPARGGSKGILRKNIKPLAGKPLIAWTIEEAKKSKYITKLILSSDDDEIIQIARKYHCEVPFKRPDHLAQDYSSGMEPVLHALENCPGYDYVLVLQPTSPFRTVEDIDNCIKKVFENNFKFCVSFTEVSESPSWMYYIDNEKLNPILDTYIPSTRQQLKKTYILNGALYMAKVEDFLITKTFLNADTKPYIMKKTNSYDIDEMLDFEWCDFLMKKKLKAFRLGEDNDNLR